VGSTPKPPPHRMPDPLSDAAHKIITGVLTAVVIAAASFSWSASHELAAVRQELESVSRALDEVYEIVDQAHPRDVGR